MSKRRAKPGPMIDCRRVELDGTQYVILRESAFQWLCRQAGATLPATGGAGVLVAETEMDRPTLAAKLARRRRAVGLTQVELARRAGVRAETLNRIERGKTTPDFATIRKLVVAMNAAEQKDTAAQ